MIEVRIRKENEPTTHAVPLCTIPLDDIEPLIESIRENGLFFDGESNNISISYQYVYYNARAYFEIIISEEPTSNEDESDT